MSRPTVADPTVADLRVAADLDASLSRAREALAAAKEALDLYEERSVLEVCVARCRAEVERLEQARRERSGGRVWLGGGL